MASRRTTTAACAPIRARLSSRTFGGLLACSVALSHPLSRPRQMRLNGDLGHVRTGRLAT